MGIKFFLGVLLVTWSFYSKSISAEPYPKPVGYLPYLVLRCQIGEDPFESTLSDIQTYTSTTYPGVGHFIHKVSQGKAQVDFSTVTDILRLPGFKSDYYLSGSKDFDLEKIYQSCAELAYLVHGYHLREFSGVLLVNNQNISAVTMLHDEIEIAGEKVDRPAVFSSHAHLFNHNVLAHELGHSLAEFDHSGGGFDPMGFGNICRESSSLGCTHSYFIGFHRRFAGWANLENTMTLDTSEDYQIVELMSVADFLADPQKHKRSKTEVVFYKILNGQKYEFSVEYRRFKDYDANIVDQGISLQARKIDQEDSLGEIYTLDFPNLASAGRQPTLSIGDVYAEPRYGLVVEPVAALIDGKTWRLKIKNSSKPLERTTFQGPHRLPGRLQAEHYDEGYQGWTYFDLDAENRGGAYRLSERVDIEGNSQIGHYLAWTSMGEWLEYSVDVQADGKYQVSALASNGNGITTQLSVFVNGVNRGTFDLKETGSWQNWEQFKLSNAIELKKGQHLIKIKFECERECHNIDWLDFTN